MPRLRKGEGREKKPPRGKAETRDGCAADWFCQEKSGLRNRPRSDFGGSGGSFEERRGKNSIRRPSERGAEVLGGHFYIFLILSRNKMIIWPNQMSKDDILAIETPVSLHFNVNL